MKACRKAQLLLLYWRISSSAIVSFEYQPFCTRMNVRETLSDEHLVRDAYLVFEMLGALSGATPGIVAGRKTILLTPFDIPAYSDVTISQAMNCV